MQKILTLTALLMWSAGAAAVQTGLLVYRVWEEGIEPYVSRVMVTEDYVRLDEGSDVAGFTLFGRGRAPGGRCATEAAAPVRQW